MDVKDFQISLCVEEYGPSRLHTGFLPEHWYVFETDKRDGLRKDWIISNLKGPWYFCRQQENIIYGFESKDDYMKFAICYEANS